MNTKSALSISLFAITASTVSGQGLNLLVESGQAYVDDPVRIPIEVDDSTGIIGASFFVTYDTSELDVAVASDFFQPIIVQLEEAGAFANGEPFLDMDIVEQGSSIQTSVVPGTGMAISASRILPADGGDNTLFVLWVSRKDGQGVGAFDLSIEPLVVSNVNAGYPPGGEEVPLLVGFVDAVYTVLLDPEGVPANIDPGVAEFLALLADDDNDFMPDPWELQYFEDLDQAKLGGDFDLDGLLDIVEFFLGLNPEDPDDPGALSLEQDGTSTSLFFPMRNIHGIDYHVEWSVDAVEWIPDNVFLFSRPDLDIGPDWTLMEASFDTGDNPHGTVMSRLVLDP